MEDQEQNFIRGFNAGYQLSKNDPSLLKLLNKSTSNSEYLRALNLGAKQHDREKLSEQLKQSKGKNQDRDR